MKFRITKSAFDKLTDDIKSEYEAADDGKGYTLVVEGMPEQEDNGELKRAKDREKQRADDLQAEVDTLTTENEGLKAKQGQPDKDVDRLTRRYETKLETQKTEFEAKIDGYKGQITKLLKTNVAAPLATTISTAPKLMQPEIEKRLEVVFPDDGDAKLVVLGADGKADDKLTVDKLKEEFVANKDFSAIIIGSKAKGGGAPSSTQDIKPGSAGASGTPEKTDLTKASRTDLTDTIRAKVEARRQASGQAA